MIVGSDILTILHLIEEHLEIIKYCMIVITVIAIFHTTTKLKLFFNKEEKKQNDDIFNKRL